MMGRLFVSSAVLNRAVRDRDQPGNQDDPAAAKICLWRQGKAIYKSQITPIFRHPKYDKCHIDHGGTSLKPPEKSVTAAQLLALACVLRYWLGEMPLTDLNMREK